MNHHHDTPARGIMVGCLLGVIIWALLGALLYIAARVIQ